MYGKAIREAFAKEYAIKGNATLALKLVLGKTRAGKMQPHTLRAKASTLLNDVRTVSRIEAIKAERQAKGEPLPRYRLRTYRTDLGIEPPEANRQARQRKAEFNANFAELRGMIASLFRLVKEKQRFLRGE